MERFHPLHPIASLRTLDPNVRSLGIVSFFADLSSEIAYIIEGQVEVTDDDGNRVVAGPGDILITPKGSKGYWKNLSPVKKVWGIYEEAGADLDAYIGPGAF